jgi:hypothetical protein
VQKHPVLLRFTVIPSLVFLVSSLAGAADSPLQGDMNSVLKADPRNSGVLVSVQLRSG